MKDIKSDNVNLEHPGHGTHKVSGCDGRIENSIVNRFEFIADRYSPHVAIRDGDEQCSFDQLNRTANAIANAIVSSLDAADKPIAVVCPLGITAIASVIGTLKSHRVFCALDPLLPEARLRQLLEELGATIALTCSVHAGFVQKCGGRNLRVIVTDQIDGRSSANKSGISALMPLAAIFYTSGSGGQPKGVGHDERKILQRVLWDTNTSHLSAKDRISMLFSLSFSASITDAFNALLNGASLCVYDIKRRGLEPLGNWISDEELTSLHIPIAVIRQWLNSLPETTRFATVRRVVPSGRMYRSDLNLMWRHFPNCEVISHMGASETGILAQMVITPSTQFSGDVVPVGYPVEDKEIVIVDEGGNEVPVGQPGEIVVRSLYLAVGYWRNEHLTAQVFVSDANNTPLRLYKTGDYGRMSPRGWLELIGRRDSRCKIRGYRVEVSEVEAILHQHAVVSDACVVIEECDMDRVKLVAYLVLKTGRPLASVNDLRVQLRTELPAYMVPASFVVLDELPRTDNGKVDKGKLPSCSGDRPILSTLFCGPRTSLEADLVKLWRNVLGLIDVGIYDDFLDLGGDSLLAMQVASEMFSFYGIRVPISSLFNSCTISTQAAWLSEQLNARCEIKNSSSVEKRTAQS